GTNVALFSRIPLGLLLRRDMMKRSEFLERRPAMIVITFPDKQTQQKALGFLLGRFSGKVLKTGEHIVPEAALAALADQNISFTVQGKASYEQQVAALRGASSGAVQ